MNGSMLPQYITPTHKHMALTAANFETTDASRPLPVVQLWSNVPASTVADKTA